ncbi:ABC-type transport auxiliary lipoprotein family protein [Enterovibrio sp. ZSDZ35]|uniref:ABC-type transport auxiliary lipoprotein family protein n=1 Tax=Enterovibrio qingdaonensis TaxID=2899818 RepID=A0ABT5QI69_9GAMM|nr:ABC-type transport auxiliary lipoprotein family protein [Enterovibrio sp. ZSDZ35]MDD1780683.1 ABC-type transport auxiliary lipoprotein family protein [Enterovibrio sp. ZSDZ35]
MKRIAALSLLAMLTVACSSTDVPKTTNYLLPAVDTTTIKYNKDMPILIVQPVNVAEYLTSSNGIAYRTAKNEVVIGQYNLWGEDIANQISERLTAELKKQHLDKWPALPTPALNGLGRMTLEVNVSRFDGNYEGDATFAGDWSILNNEGDIVTSQGFEINEPLSQEGYPALVAALGRALTGLSVEIADVLRK